MTNRTLTALERENLTNDLRRKWQKLSDRDLSHAVNAVALEPRRYDPLDRKALLMTAASRLWRANGEGS